MTTDGADGTGTGARDEKARLEAGLSTDDLLRGLREQRERYHGEQYGDAV